MLGSKSAARRELLQAAGVPCLPVVVNHDDSEMGVSAEVHDGVFVRSVYFRDPNGIMLEFASFLRPLGGPDDVRHEPKSAAKVAETVA